MLSAVKADLAAGTATGGRLLLQRQALEALCQLAVLPGRLLAGGFDFKQSLPVAGQ